MFQMLSTKYKLSETGKGRNVTGRRPVIAYILLRH